MTSRTDLLPAGVRVFERGWLSANNILMVGEDDVALVDSGYASHAGITVELVRQGLASRSLTTLVNTHLHSDHCGGNARLQAEYPGLRTLIPPGLARYVEAWDPVRLTYVPTGQECPRFKASGVLAPGESIALGGIDWQVHAAPGHDPNSVIFFEPRTRTLLSADALWQNGFGVVFQELEGEEAFDEVAATLDLIEALDPLVVVPGHGPVFTDVPPALARARSRLAAYRSNPVRHATHAAKVLLKFRLLDRQAMPVSELLAWASGTPYFGMVHARWFAAQPFQRWISQLLEELVKSGAAWKDTDMVRNS